MSICKSLLITLIVISTLYLLNLYVSSSVNPKLNLKYKSEMVEPIREYCCDYYIINRDKITPYELQHIKYPCIFKPNYCDGFAHAVSLVKSPEEAEKYLGKSLDKSIIIQEFHPGPYEATVYIRRLPGSNETTVYLVERVNPNRDKDKEWLWKSSISYKHDYFTRHRTDLETPQFISKITEITNRFPDVYLVRYDIRFSSYEELKRGEGFKIIELNEHCSDTRYSHTNTKEKNLEILIEHLYNYYKIGIMNVVSGNGVSFSKFCSSLLNSQIVRAHKCRKYYVYYNMLKKAQKSY